MQLISLILLISTYFSVAMLKKSFICMRTKINPSIVSPYEVALANAQIVMPAIILVEPFSDANIGSCSRAMLNFGMTDLRIVNPQVNHLSDTAKMLAVGSFEILENAKIYDTLESAISDLSKVIATTARIRGMSQIIYTPMQAAKEAVFLTSTENLNQKVGIVMGRERGGLTNFELSLANSIINIPTFESYPVINLAQSVNILGYEMFKRRLELEDGPINDESDTKQRIEEIQDGDIKIRFRSGHEMVTRTEIDAFLNRLENELHARDYQGISKNNNFDSIQDDDDKKRQLNFSSIKNLFLRVSSLISNADLKVLHGVITALIREKNR